jgi:hypothetical protein
MPITIVSGLPRSGTSLMMQMLVAGGLTPLTDNRRAPDASNPRGYFEWEKAERLPREPDLIAEAGGRVIKIVSTLILSLPPCFSYRVIFMERDLLEVVASHQAMFQTLGMHNRPLSPDALREHLNRIKASLQARPEFAVCLMDHHQVIAQPKEAACKVQRFLNTPLDIQAMVSRVDSSLYRQRQIGPSQFWPQPRAWLPRT